MLLRPWLLLLALVPTFAFAKTDFNEVWAYLAPDAELTAAIRPGITDWAFFGPTLSSQGELTNLPRASRIGRFPGRHHLVVAVVDNFALTHMAVTKQFPVRAALLDQIVAAAAPYEGVQLDFETVVAKDRADFWSFVADLKAKLGRKILSLAVPAHLSPVDDSFPYSKLGTIVDRLIVMAYDEHWSGSRPGPIASLDWGERVAQWALKELGPDKLVMGAPLYGRSWGERTLSRAHTFNSAAGLLRSKGLDQPQRTGSIPFFEYDETVHVRMYYEDKVSQQARLERYFAAGVRKMAFWRLGQEDPSLWDVLTREPPPLLWPRADSLLSNETNY